MPNHCYCGRSQMMPWCDGSHDGHDNPEAQATDTRDSKPAPETKSAPPRKGWLARLFGRN